MTYLTVFLTYFSIYLGIVGTELSPLAFHLCCCYFSAVLIVGVPFPFGVKGRMRNSIVSIPDHCLFIYLNLDMK